MIVQPKSFFEEFCSRCRVQTLKSTWRELHFVLFWCQLHQWPQHPFTEPSSKKSTVTRGSFWFGNFIGLTFVGLTFVSKRYHGCLLQHLLDVIHGGLWHQARLIPDSGSAMRFECWDQNTPVVIYPQCWTYSKCLCMLMMVTSNSHDDNR